MKSIVNGVEIELAEKATGCSASNIGSQVIIKTPQGSRSAVVRQVRGKIFVSYLGRVYEIEQAQKLRKAGAISSGELKAMMPGMIVEVSVAVGDHVQKGQKLVVLEAMKTQQPIESPFEGIVEFVNVSKGAQVVDGEILVKIAPKLP